jgi:hypothetical protein
VIYAQNGESLPVHKALLLHIIQHLKNMYSRVNEFTHTNRMTSGKSFIHSFNCQFFDRLTSYPSDVWVIIVARMNVNVFQYKLLVIPSTQDNHKLLYVVLGLHNVLDCDKNIGDCDHTCIIHLEVGKHVMNHSLVSITPNKIRLLMNMLYRTHIGQENDKIVIPFRTRLMPLRRPESEIS